MIKAGVDTDVPYVACVATDYEYVHRDPVDAIRVIVEREAGLGSRGDAIVIRGSDYSDVTSPAVLVTNALIAANLAAAIVLVVGDEARLRSVVGDFLGEPA